MKVLAVIAAIGAAFFNYSHEWIAKGTRFSPYAVWYIEQCFWVAILALLAAWMVWGYKDSPARDLALLGLSFAAWEGLSSGVARLMVSYPSQIPPGTSVLDFVTGLPTQAVGITFYFFLIVRWICRAIRRT